MLTIFISKGNEDSFIYSRAKSFARNLVLFVFLFTFLGCGQPKIEPPSKYTAKEWVTKGLGLYDKKSARFKQPELAIRYFSNALTVDSNFNVAYAHRARAYNAVYRITKEKSYLRLSLADSNIAIKNDPDEKLAYYARGISYGRLGDIERAIMNFDTTLALDPNDFRAYNNRGYALLLLKKQEKAIQDFNKSIKLDQTSFRSYTNRARAHSELGQISLACKDWRTACEMGAKQSCKKIQKRC